MQVTHNLIALILYSLCCLTESNKDCDKKRNEFANDVTNFERCAIQMAVPVTFCDQCIAFYVAQLQSFQDMITTHDSQNPRKMCGDRYIGHDRLDIVQNRYHNAKELWNSGSCTSCFVASCDPDHIQPGINISEVCTKNADVMNVQQSILDFEDCLKQSDARIGDVCKDCLHSFDLLSSHFSGINSKLNGGVCFDLVDMFNRTQATWYKDRDCSAEKVNYPSGWGLFSILFALICLSGASYGGFYYYKGYRMRSAYLHTAIDNQNERNFLNSNLSDDRISNSGSIQ